LTAEGTTSKGTGSISFEVEFCIFYRLSLRTLQTKVILYVVFLSTVTFLIVFYYKIEQQWCQAISVFQTISDYKELCHLCLNSNFFYGIIHCYFYQSYQFIGNLEMLQCLIYFFSSNTI
jgi:hypothetical protein